MTKVVKLADLLTETKVLEDGLLPSTPLVKIYVGRNCTADNLIPSIRRACALRGVRAQVVLSDYDSYQQDIHQQCERYTTAQIAVLAWWGENIRGSLQECSYHQDILVSHVKTTVDAALRGAPVKLMPFSFSLPFASVRDDSAYAALDRVNQALLSACENSAVRWIRSDSIDRELGWRTAHDPQGWHRFRAPWTTAALVALAEQVADEAAMLCGLAKKVLVLDCDNTLWGGVVGEEGLTGIQLDPASYPGSCFYAFQQQLLSLQRRGVLLAICSKNNEADVLEVLDRHPHAILKREHFAVIKANWMEKNSNLVEISREINVGLDSLVFIDDSAFECGAVRAGLPKVTVVELPADAVRIPEILVGQSWFYQGASSQEDTTRTTMISAESRRAQAATGSDPDSFLKSLELVATVRAAVESDVRRVAQLTQKTNQFNLTTLRCTEAETQAWISDKNRMVLVLEASDKFGAYGLVGVAVLAHSAEAVFVEVLLMSCRALGRGLEMAFLSALSACSREQWADQDLIGEYKPTAKNMITENFYAMAGWVKEIASGERVLYRLDCAAQMQDTPEHIKLERKKNG